MIIGICDDNAADRADIEVVCKRILSQGYGNVDIDSDETNTAYEVIQFQDGKELLESNFLNKIDILLLDIEMQSISGLDVKEKLFKIGNKTIIIFVSNYDDYALSGYGLNVFAYVKKCDLMIALSEVFKSAVSILSNSIMLDDDILSDDILYIRAEHVYCIICLRDGKKKLIRSSLKNLYERLSHYGFVKISRSYVINMRWIDKITEDSAIIKNTEFAISTRRKSDVRKIYLQYCEKHARYH